jgi:rSAM/selenodomain-associated transferase 2
MAGRPILTVVIPVLNEVSNLERLLPRLGAACPGAEIIVVDGASRDGSREVAQRHGARVLSSAQGRAQQMNAGAAVAAGDTLVFLHADTELPPKALLAIEAALQDAEVVGGRFDVRLDSPRPLLRLVAALMNARSRLTGIATGDQAIFVRRSVFESLGGYAGIPLMEDVEFTSRLRRTGRLACLRLAVTTSARKWEREGVLRTILLMWSLRVLYWLGVSPARLHRWYYPNLKMANGQ